jgi:hypothetical protein
MIKIIIFLYRNLLIIPLVRTARKRTGSRETLARIDLRVDLGLFIQLWQVIFPLVKFKKMFFMSLSRAFSTGQALRFKCFE